MSQIKKNSIATIILIVLALAFLLESLNFVYASFKKTPNSYEPPLSDISFDDKNVLFISSYSPTHPALFYETTGLAEIFDHNNVNFDIVYMDTEKYNDPENFRHFYNAITYKLNSYKKYDGIIAGDDAALMFVQEYQSELFPNMPIVFFATEDLAAAERASQNPNMAGVAQKLFLTDTIQLALKVNPAATKICAIVDNSLTGKGDQKQFFAEKRNFPDKEFFTINTDEKSRAQITESLGAIDDHTILIFMSFLSDMDGQHYSLTESLALITKSVAVPVYRTKVGGMGMGVFGGKIYDLKSAGIQAAQMMTDVISQKANISQILQSGPIGGTYYIDTQLMKKFGIKKRLLPKSTVFVNESNGGDSGRKNLSIAAVFFAIALMLVAAAIIVGYLYAKKAQNVVRMRNIAIARKNRMLKESAKRMKIMSENDFLTEIPNRFSAVTEISRLLEANAKFSLYLMDIDDFKNINDYYTHECGDAVLKEFAKRLQFLTQEFDCFVARYGGDEFMLIYRNAYLSQDADSLDTIKLVMSQPFFHKNTKLEMKMSGGIADSESGIELNDLISNADLALYNAKKHGKNSTLFYAPTMKKAIYEKNHISSILQKYCKNKGFLVHYQPQIDAQTGEIHGFEALCRLDKNEFGPAKFIPIAEECGYIAAIGRIVTEKVISQMAQWRRKGLPLKKVAINYSSGQLVDADYVQFLTSLLEKYDIPSNMVEIEITESLFMGNTADVHKLFESLSKLGVKLALDDFGTGYSSLSYLTYLQVDKVKIDKTLVDNYLVEGKENFIKNIVHLVHDLGMELTVEGVEQEWQFELLKKLHCDYIQGYLFSKPLPSEAVETFKPKIL